MKKRSLRPMRRVAALALSALVLTFALPAHALTVTNIAAKNQSGLELEVDEMELQITAEDPRPRGYLTTDGDSDYYFIVWMSSNPAVATVDADGKVTGRSAGSATITAISDRGDRASCKITVTQEDSNAAAAKPALDETTINLTIQYDNLHPTRQLKLINNEKSFIYVYRWISSNKDVATVDEKGNVTAQSTGTATITAMASNGQALRCSVTVTSDVGKLTLNQHELQLRESGDQEKLTAEIAAENSALIPVTWVSSNPGVAIVDTNGVVTAVAEGEARITALTPEGKSDVCTVTVGTPHNRYSTARTLTSTI